MSYAESILPEFDHEIASARSVLECVPDELLTWRAGASFNTIGWNANHLAEIVGWVEGTFAQTQWDIAPIEGPKYQSPNLPSIQDELVLIGSPLLEDARASGALGAEDRGRRRTVRQRSGID